MNLFWFVFIYFIIINIEHISMFSHAHKKLFNDDARRQVDTFQLALYIIHIVNMRVHE